MLDSLLLGWMQHLVKLRPEALGHIEPKAILCVAGAARRQARASVRPFCFPGPVKKVAGPWTKPEITIFGQPILYEICLRPRFFLSTTAAERLRILVHELWHISPRFDGTLADARSHRHGTFADHDPADNILNGLTPESLPHGEFLAHDGEMRMQAWLSRPPSRIRTGTGLRLRYDERDLHAAVVIQRNRSTSLEISREDVDD